jgi:hypothetical protein
MKNENTFLKAAMTHGAIMGLVLILLSVVNYVLGFEVAKKLGWLSYVVIVLGVYFGQKAYRDKELDGLISYSTSLGYGLLIAVFAGFITGLFTFILYQYIDPDLMAKQLDAAIQMYVDMGYSDEQIEEIVSMSEKFKSPVVTALSTTFGFAIMGLIVSLITSIFIKKEGDGFDAAMQEIEEDKE